MTEAPPRLLTRAFLLLTAAHFLQAIGYSSMLLLPLYLDHVGANRTQIGAIMATAAFSGVLLRPVVAWSLDHLGRKPTIFAGTLLLGAGMGLLYFVEAPDWVAYASRLVAGVGLGATFASYFAFAADLIPPSRRTEGIALFGITGLLPLMINPLVAELGVDAAALQWFLPLMGGAVCLSLVFVALVPETSITRGGPRSGLTATLRALVARRVLPVWFATGIFSFLVAVFMSFATVVAASAGAERPAGLWFTYAGGAAAVRLLGARLPDRVGTHNMVVPALAAYIGACFAMAMATTDQDFMAAGLLAGLGHGYTFPVLTSQVVSRVPDAVRGAGLSTFTALWDVTRLIGAPTMGFLADLQGDQVMFMCAGAVAVAGLAVWAVLEHVMGGDS